MVAFDSQLHHMEHLELVLLPTIHKTHDKLDRVSLIHLLQELKNMHMPSVEQENEDKVHHEERTCHVEKVHVRDHVEDHAHTTGCWLRPYTWTGRLAQIVQHAKHCRHWLEVKTNLL